MLFLAGSRCRRKAQRTDGNTLTKEKHEAQKMCRLIPKRGPELRGLVVFVALVLSACGCSQENQGDNAAKNTEKRSTAAETSTVDRPFRVSNARIAFVSNRDGNYEVYAMDTEGSDPANLTANSARDDGPAFSPDGNRVVFASDRDGNNEIYTMNADGTGQTRLTNDPAFDYAPAFSPDGERIAFASDRDGNYEIYVMGTDGSDLVNLTRIPANDGAPAFSPDGNRIVFASDRDGNYEVYTMNADGTGQTRLTNDPAFDGDPLFSPERSKIAFTSERDGDAEIYAMDADGSHQERLTDNSAGDGHLSLFEGRRMAFSSDRDGDAEIYAMDADGSHQEQLTNNAVDEVLPAFPAGQQTENSVAAEATTGPPPATTAASRNALKMSNPILITDDLPYYPPEHRREFTISPEGDKVAFVIGKGAYQGIYVVKSDGSRLSSLGLTSLDKGMTAEGQTVFPPDEPIFSSDGDKIAFARTIPRRRPSEFYRHQYDLYMVKSDGTDLTNITSTDSVSEQNPVFSVDGAKMAFVRPGDGPNANGEEIYTMDSDGTNPIDLTDSAGNDLDPAFSPKGGKIAFASNRGGDMGNNFEVYAMDSDGSNQTRLTIDAAWDDNPTFSPDGKKVAFTRSDPMSPEDTDVYVVNVDGTGLKRLTHYPAYDGQPAFVPGTDMLAFVSPRDGDEDIYALRSDGTGLTNLTTTDSANEAAPTFSADGTKMAYASARRDESGKVVYEIYVARLGNID
jgi:Tol biopolymer transport system component